MGDAGGSARDEPARARLAALEAEVTALRGELEQLRRIVDARSPDAEHPATGAPQPSIGRGPTATNPRAPRRASGQKGVEWQGRAISGDELESFVGRYGTNALGALVSMLGVGTLLVWAVNRGLLTPEVRVALGALAAALVGAAGIYFRRRGERRYGNVLIALALAMTDLVAWGAGPRLQVVPTSLALVIVDVVALAVAWLAVQDESEFLFAVAILGALAAPFVTLPEGGRAAPLLAYGGAVLLGAMRVAHDPRWWRTILAMLAGAGFYVLAAAALPAGTGWYAPYLIPLFGGVLSPARSPSRSRSGGGRSPGGSWPLA